VSQQPSSSSRLPIADGRRIAAFVVTLVVSVSSLLGVIAVLRNGLQGFLLP
jgi:hypothetical protein